MHLEDVGDLSSPALAKILRDTANSPTAFHDISLSPAASAATSGVGGGSGGSVGGGGSGGGRDNSLSILSDGSSPLVGINLAHVASPATSLASLLSGGPLEPPVPALGAPSRVNVNAASGNTSAGRVDAAQAFLSAGSGMTAGDGAESPAGSPTHSRENSAAGRGSVGRSSSWRSSLTPQRLGLRSSSPRAPSVGVSGGRSFVPSPINAVAKEESAAPWEFNNGVFSASDFGGADVPGTDGKYQVYHSGNPSESGRGAQLRRSEQGFTFDEQAFAEQEQRMRHAFIIRMGSVDSSSAGGSSKAGEGGHLQDGLRSRSRSGSGEQLASVVAGGRCGVVRAS